MQMLISKHCGPTHIFGVIYLQGKPGMAQWRATEQLQKKYHEVTRGLLTNREVLACQVKGGAHRKIATANFAVK
jgi:hypothetical protein